MATAGADIEMKFIDFIDEPNSSGLLPSLVIGSSGRETVELNSETSTRKQETSPDRSRQDDSSDQRSSQKFTDSLDKSEMEHSKSDLCFKKVSPSNTSQKSVSLLSKMLQHLKEDPVTKQSASVGEFTQIPTRDIQLGVSSIDQQSATPLSIIRKVNQQRYQTYFEEAVQIW